jgi:hypothetical protein
MSRNVSTEFDNFMRLSLIADAHIKERKIRNMKKPFGALWENLYGLAEIEEFESLKEAEDFAAIMDGEAITSGRIIA